MVLHGSFRMEYIDLFEVVIQVLALVGPQDTQRKADQGPQVDDPVIPAVMLAQFVNLGVAVVASGDTVIRLGGLDLAVLELAVLEALLLETGLQEAPAAPAAEIVGAVGLHIDEIFLADHRFDHEAQVFGNRIAETLADDLARVLDRKFDFQVLVPVGVDLEFAFTDPLGVILVNIFDFKVVLEVEFFQSGPD
jgi:hypothetical protein